MSAKALKRLENEILSPTYDFTFKGVFASENVEIVTDFLQSILTIPVEEYDRIEFVDTHLKREFEEDKLGIVDLLIHTKSKKIVHVEMQVDDKENFRKRAIYYNSDLLASQLQSSQDYDILEKTISILIVDFNVFQSPSYTRRINYRCEEGEIFDDLTEFHVLELKKVPKEFDGTKICEWAKFFTSKNEEEFYLVAEKNPEIRKAVGVLKVLSEDEQNRMWAKREEKLRRDRVAEIKFGHSRGLEEGIEQASVEIAKKFLKLNIPVELVSEGTGLPIETILSIQSGLNLE